MLALSIQLVAVSVFTAHNFGRQNPLAVGQHQLKSIVIVKLFALLEIGKSLVEIIKDLWRKNIATHIR